MKRVLILALAAVVAAGASAQMVPGSGMVKGPMSGEAQKLNGAGGTFPPFCIPSGSASTPS